MYSAGRTTNIDESTRRQLLDNYLRNQQMNITSSVPQGVSQQQFHPSQFQAPPIIHSDQRSETFSDISRRSITSQQQLQQNNPNNLVQVSEQRISNNNEALSIVPTNELPDNLSIGDFTNLVRKWIELDNWIKKSQEIAKQKRKQKEKLGEVITQYMTKYNIEDLNTSEGKIRCKVRYVKSGVNQKVVKEKITELLKDNEETCNTLITKIFDEREKVEKVSLRRIKIT